MRGASPSREDRQPNQGGFVDLPAWLAADGREHWYFLTHHGDEKAGPNGRPVSLLPVSWRDGWPIPGRVGEAEAQDSEDWTQGLAGVNSIRPVPAGSMLWQCPVPPVRGSFPSRFSAGKRGVQCAPRALSCLALEPRAHGGGVLPLGAGRLAAALCRLPL